MATRIEWCDETINPIVGCRRISPACDHCYAERMAARGMCEAHRKATRDGRWTGEAIWQDGQIEKLSRWRKSRRIFVGSMTDLALAGGKEWRRVWAAMVDAPWHDYLVLTKRPAQLECLVGEALRCTAGPPLLWVGVTVETEQWADARISALLCIPAARHFLSLEPLLGPLPDLDLRGIDWVIVGAETGPGARPMHGAWARAIRDQCVAAGVPFFFKRGPDGTRVLDGRTWEQVP